MFEVIFQNSVFLVRAYLYLFARILFFGIAIGLSLKGLYAEKDCEKSVCSYFEKTSKSEYKIFIQNKNLYPVSIRLELKLINMTTTLPAPYRTVVSAQTETSIITLMQDKPGQKFKWNYKWWWKSGSFQQRPDYDFVYRLPGTAGTEMYVSQGYNGTFTHNGEFNKYSLDFKMDEGTPIHAARGGLVVNVVNHYTEGGVGEQFKNKQNMISILHDDGTFGEYLHLKENGAIVQEGQKVKTGDLIGYSGNTGYSSIPHLHFHVNHLQSDFNRNRIKTLFKAGGQIKPVYLQKQTRYTVVE